MDRTAKSDFQLPQSREAQNILDARNAVLEEAAREVESAGGDSTEYHARRIRELKSL